MSTPNKLSLSWRKKKKEPVIVLSDSDDDKENSSGALGSTSSRNSRRCSTILAGAGNFLPMLEEIGVLQEVEEEEDEDGEGEVSIISNITVRRRGPGNILPARRINQVSNERQSGPSGSVDNESNVPDRRTDFLKSGNDVGNAAGQVDLITDDESDFYSCQGSETGEMNKALMETWMTDITMKKDTAGAKAKDTTATNEKDTAPPPSFQTPRSKACFKRPEGSTVKKSSVFSSIGKKPTRAQVLISSSSESEDDAIGASPREIGGNTMEKTVVVASDSEVDTPVKDVFSSPVPSVQMGREFLSNSRFGNINSWVARSPFSSSLDITEDEKKTDDKDITDDDEDVDSLLKSDPEDGEAVPSWAAPIPGGKRSGRDGNPIKERDSLIKNRRNVTKGGEISKVGSGGVLGASKVGRKSRETSNPKGAGEVKGSSQDTSKAGGSWNQKSKISRKDGRILDGSSQDTSKAGGSWNQKSKIISQDGGSSQDTSKAGGSWNEKTKNSSVVTSKVGGCSQDTSKAGGSWNDQLPSQTDSSWNVNATSQATSKAGGSWNTNSVSQGNKTSQGSQERTKTNTSGKSVKKRWDRDWVKDAPTETPELEQTVSDFDKLRLTPRVPRTASKAGSSLVNSLRKIAAMNTSRGDFVPDPESFHLHLSLSPSNTEGKTNKSLNLDGLGTVSKTESSVTVPPLSSSSSVPPPPTSPVCSPNISLAPAPAATPSFPRIDNSVCGAGSAVRSWEEVVAPPPSVGGVSDVWGRLGSGVSHESQQIELQKRQDDSASDEAELDRFLNNLKSSKKRQTVISSDSDGFVVPDEDSEDDSDEFPAPTLNLRQRLEQERKKKGKPSTSPNKSSTSSQSLPDIEKEAIPTPVRRKPVRSGVKKQFVFDSDSDEGSPAVNYISRDDDDSPIPVNSVEIKKPPAPPKSSKKSTSKLPKSMKSPPTVSAKKTPKPREGVGGSKLSPQTGFKTPVVKDRQPYQFQLPTPSLTFLSSLTMDTPLERCHPDARKYIKNFNKTKVELARRLFDLYNKEVFDLALPEDMQIDWNKRLTKTAGLCYSRRAKNRFGIETRTARLELSTKIIDRGDRLRDTLIHEMCHAASWIISGYRDGHGPLWRSWGEKATFRFPELPIIGRCHSYTIETKFTYKCTQCGYSIGRHSKSLDMEKKVCGKCMGRFELLVKKGGISSKKGGREDDAELQPQRSPNPFAIFVKDQYKVYKRPGVEHREVMRILSAKFAATKIDQQTGE